MKSNQFYCVKCKSKVMCEDKHIQMKKLRNGKPALKSSCRKCGTTVFKFIKLSDAKKMKSRSRSGGKKRSKRSKRSKKHSKSRSKSKRRSRSLH
jgi:hypothetical protein